MAVNKQLPPSFLPHRMLQLVLCLGSANVLRIATLNLGGSAKCRKGVELREGRKLEC
jgi:hypothetical protein